jgi:SNF2 family DNA or RNA helicase
MPTLRPQQEEDVQEIIRHRLRVLVANAPGTGKTPVTIESLGRTYLHTTPALVVVPPSVLRNWEREFQKWAPDLRTHVVESGTSFPRRITERDVVLIGWPLIDPRLDELLGVPWRCIVADEAHFAKNPDAQRSQALRALCTPERGLLLLTGTPIVNSTDEMDQLESLYGTKPPMIRRLLSEVAPDIPPKKRSYLHVDLRSVDSEEYRQAHDDFEGWLRKSKESLEGEGYSESEIERKLSAESLIKIGYLRRILGKGKAYAAADFASRAVRVGEPVVFFCEHKAVVARLAKSLRKARIRFGVIDGSVNVRRRQQAIDDFQHFKMPVMICSKAGKEGITLHAARHLVFIERFYTSADEEQAEDRIRRIGQRFRTTIWFMHVPGTVDDRVDVIVRTKRQLVASTIGTEQIAETAIANVEEIIRDWEKTVGVPKGKRFVLGNGKPLPPLPSPGDTVGILFSGKRWSLNGARLWAKMNGYHVIRFEPIQNGVKLRVHERNRFQDGSFKVFRAAEDIAVIVGVQKAKAAKKKYRRQEKNFGR